MNKKTIIICIAAVAALAAGVFFTVKYRQNLFAKKAMNRIVALADQGKLSTTEYSFSQVIPLDDSADKWKIGERKALLSCRAYVEAGVDMTKYDAEKTHIDKANKTISITLPPVEIINFNMDPNQMKVQYLKVTGMRTAITQQERAEKYKEGEEEIRKMIPSSGIYEEAEKNAVRFFTDLLVNAGFDRSSIEITFEPRKRF